jgi:hypothetical protein
MVAIGELVCNVIVRDEDGRVQGNWLAGISYERSFKSKKQSVEEKSSLLQYV